jgi:hypothetical protein
VVLGLIRDDPPQDVGEIGKRLNVAFNLQDWISELAIANTLIQTCKLNRVEPLAYLTDVLRRIVPGQARHHELHALLPLNGRQPSTIAAA